MRSARFAIIPATALLLAGCGPSQVSVNVETNAKSESNRMVLRLGNGSEPEDLDPQVITGVPEHHIVMALFEGLVSADPTDLHPLPGLADSWNVSNDGRTYTFHLRDGIRWSDGVPITTADFIGSYKRMLTPAFAAQYANFLYDYVVNAKEYYDGTITDFSQVGFRAIDERTLEVRLKFPVPYLLNIIAGHQAWTAVPIHIVERFGGLERKSTDWTRPGNLVGSGPFVLSQWLPDQKVVVERNPYYWDAKNVRLDAIEFYAISDDAAEERLFRTGQLDMTNSLPLSKIDVYRQDYPDQLRISPYLGIYYYVFNIAKPPLNDPRVRKALALAIDREAIVNNVTRGGQRAAYSVSYPNTLGYTPRARLTGDIAEAQRLLAEAGYPGGRGMPPIELLYNTSEAHRSIAEAIQAMWRTNLGVDLRLENQEWAVYLSMTEAKNFELARGGWIADYVHPNSLLEIWESRNGNNHSNWANPEYDRLYQEALAASSEEARYEIYQRMDQILVNEVPLVPIYHYTRVYAVSPRVRGISENLLDLHPYKYVWISDN